MDREHVRPAIRVAVAAPFPEIVAIHGRAAEYADEIDFCGAISDAASVLEQTRRLQPEVLLLSEELGFDDAEFLTQLTAVAPTTRLVVLVHRDSGAAQGFADGAVSRDAAAGELRAAIVAAARRVEAGTGPPAHSRAAIGAIEHGGMEADETRWFSEMHDQGGLHAADPVPEVPAARGPTDAADRVTERPARMVLVFSGKGGVGKSLVATNLATALTLAGSRVALVDLNLQYGDAGVLLHLEAYPTTIDAVAAVVSAGERLDPDLLDAALATTPEGLRVLLAPRSPEFADLVSAASLGAILTELGRSHDYLVVDSPAHLEERILGVMEVADQVLLVTSCTIAAVKDAKLTLRLMQSLGIEAGRVAVVLNQTIARIGFAAEDIERALRYPILANLPYEPRMDESIDNGRPLVLSEPRCGFSRQLQQVVDHLGRERDASATHKPTERPVKWRLRFTPR